MKNFNPRLQRIIIRQQIILVQTSVHKVTLIQYWVYLVNCPFCHIIFRHIFFITKTFPFSGSMFPCSLHCFYASYPVTQIYTHISVVTQTAWSRVMLEIINEYQVAKNFTSFMEPRGHKSRHSTSCGVFSRIGAKETGNRGSIPDWCNLFFSVPQKSKPFLEINRPSLQA
jgi:hypothetical protein